MGLKKRENTMVTFIYLWAMAGKIKSNSALSVAEGVIKPPSVNPYLQKKTKSKISTAQYVEGINNGNRTLLSKAITLVESNLQEHYQQAQEIINQCLPLAVNSIRVGITGVPGVGKSSFIEVMGKHIIDKGYKLAVLAIDPSSERSGGSILGDKTRMEDLSTKENVFIRPSPSAGSLGGVARKTRETILLCEAAGFNVIFIETVGVGQSETAVHSMVDFFLLLMLAGAGDELQGIKRGIMEMADMIAITKADGENITLSARAAAEYRSALHLFPPTESGWIPPVLTCSSFMGLGIDTLWENVQKYVNTTNNSGYFIEQRKQQQRYWMKETILERLRSNFYSNETVLLKLNQLEADVLSNKENPFSAATKILDFYFDKK